jgi:hypothetical protein
MWRGIEGESRVEADDAPLVHQGHGLERGRPDTD